MALFVKAAAQGFDAAVTDAMRDAEHYCMQQDREASPFFLLLRHLGECVGRPVRESSTDDESRTKYKVRSRDLEMVIEAVNTLRRQSSLPMYPNVEITSAMSHASRGKQSLPHGYPELQRLYKTAWFHEMREATREERRAVGSLMLVSNSSARLPNTGTDGARPDAANRDVDADEDGEEDDDDDEDSDDADDGYGDDEYDNNFDVIAPQPVSQPASLERQSTVQVEDTLVDTEDVSTDALSEAVHILPEAGHATHPFLYPERHGREGSGQPGTPRFPCPGVADAGISPGRARVAEPAVRGLLDQPRAVRLKGYERSRGFDNVNRLLALTVCSLEHLGMPTKLVVRVAVRAWKFDQLSLAENVVATMANSLVYQGGFNACQAGGRVGKVAGAAEAKNLVLWVKPYMHDNLDGVYQELDDHSAFIQEMDDLADDGDRISLAADRLEATNARLETFAAIGKDTLVAATENGLARLTQKAEELQRRIEVAETLLELDRIRRESASGVD
ncbi:hypothetical protein ACCO45_013523 [Purpureocillium lilacinum]|uniref:Uncharacterized protein n=1 Tax=Purpureocillium lilacinum TaxID=33203 RepID=A0ACC4D8G0_PURLI